MLGQKKKVTNEQWEALFRNIGNIVSKAEIDNAIDICVEELKAASKGKRVGFAWSGGKDSIALYFLCKEAGIINGVWGKTQLEYPAFEQWCYANKPDGVRVYDMGLNLVWLSKHQGLLFPANGPTDDKWMPITYWKAQQQFYDNERLDMLVLGRRLKDGNFCGKNKFHVSKSKVSYNPMAFWSHEYVLALIHYYHLPLPPIYQWPEGWVYGTHEWARRNLKHHTVNEVWGAIYQIDKSIVCNAAGYIPSARNFLITK